jgi:hypothetical protein
MVIAGINVTDTDSLTAASDMLDEIDEITCPECGGRRSITDYSPDAGWVNIVCPACLGIGSVPAGDPDADGYDPEPPTPAAPALALVPCGGGLGNSVEEACRWCAGTGIQSAACPACQGTGVCPRYPDGACWMCSGAGTDHRAGEQSPATPVPFDRAQQCRRIGQTGGLATYQRHGSAHMRAIGKAGYRAAVANHGVAHVAGILAAKGWHGPRQPDLLADLRAGRLLADLDRAA